MAHSTRTKILDSLFTTDLSKAVELKVWPASEVDALKAQLSSEAQQWLNQTNFEFNEGQVALIPEGQKHIALGVVGDSSLAALAQLAAKLPIATYQVSDFPDTLDLKAAAIGWGLDQYRFEHYLAQPRQAYRQLVLEDDMLQAVRTYLEAHFLVRDLVNTPTENMGPSELSYKMQALASEFNAPMTEIKGNQLEKEYPAIWTVGRACDDAPRLLHFTWGDDSNPKVTLVGKGVCFDSGGLDIKPASGMRLMKKDMGGAAHVLGLARLIMAFNLPIKLDVYVSAVENSISGNAFRPGDIITTRKGLTVEVGNTDAEGRLVLCDALTRACEDQPDLIIDFATLTGAARVALGAELPALFSNDDELAHDICANGLHYEDPVWQMPLFKSYRRHIEPGIADLVNMSSSPFGGAITAALFLESFIEPGIDWCHFDVMAYSSSYRTLHPEGGEAFALMAVFHTLEQRYGA